jgi:hypothetical protein
MISFPIFVGLFLTELMEQWRENALFSAPSHVSLVLICFESYHRSDYQGHDYFEWFGPAWIVASNLSLS